MESRFSCFYNTNHIPSDEELVEIQQLLAPSTAKLAQLDTELKATEAAVARLKTEREAIVALTRPLNSLDSLMRRIPQEIMERIFVQSLPAGGYGTFNACDSPLVLLRVCRLWREIALGAPELWTSIDIIVPVHLISAARTPDPKNQQRVASLLAEVNRWLVRSGNHPLSIRTPERFSPDPNARTEEIMDKIYSRLALHSHRWRSGDYCLYPKAVIPVLDGLGAGTLPRLRHLRLFSYLTAQGPYKGEEIFHYAGLLKAPNLQKLHIEIYGGQAYPSRFTSLPINWSKLTSLTFGCTPSYIFTLFYNQGNSWSMWIDILPIFRTCTNLQVCALMLPSDNGHVDIPTSRATLPSLVALHLSGCSDAIDWLLQFIHAPCIQELHYQPLHSKILGHNIPISPRPPLSQTSPLSTFLQISGTKIEVLSVNVPPSTSSDALHACLDNTPFLKQLTFGTEYRNHSFPPRPHTLAVETENAFVFTDSNLHALTPTLGDEEQSHLCPRLEILRCSNVKCQITEAAVIAFLSAKIHPSSSSTGLRSTKFRELSMNMLQLDAPFGGVSDMDDDGPLGRFRDAGVKLSFSKTDYYSPSPPSLHSFTLGYGVDFAI